jgi:hypothetical protein
VGVAREAWPWHEFDLVSSENRGPFRHERSDEDDVEISQLWTT